MISFISSIDNVGDNFLLLKTLERALAQHNQKLFLFLPFQHLFWNERSILLLHFCQAFF